MVRSRSLQCCPVPFGTDELVVSVVLGVAERRVRHVDAAAVLWTFWATLTLAGFGSCLNCCCSRADEMGGLSRLGLFLVDGE